METHGASEVSPHSGRKRRRRRSGLIGLLAIMALAVAAGNASAVIVRVHGKRLSYQPTRNAAGAVRASSPSGPAEYHGGPVMTSNTNYTLYWDPTKGTKYPARYQSGINTYFEDLAHDSGGLQNIDSVLAQYSGLPGEFASYDSHFGGALTDANPYPANGCSAAPICLTDEQLRAQIRSYVEANKLPMDLQHEYFLLTPPGVESCFEAAGLSCSQGTSHAAYCAYHGFIQVGSAVIVYSNDPYVDEMNCDVGEEHPNNSSSDAAIGGGIAHEHSESLTDPELNAWYDGQGREVADKCRTFKKKTEYGEPLGTAPDGSKYNQLINGDLYWYQQVWSNEAGECVQRLAHLPTVKKLAPKSGPSAGGTSVTITGAHFSSPASVKFGEAPAAEVTVNSSTSITAVSPAGTMGPVNVTVTTTEGTSAIVKKDRFKYKK